MSESQAVVALTAAEQWLEKARTAEDLAGVADMAAVAAELARRVRLGTSAINKATEIRLRAESRLAGAVSEGQAAGTIARGRPKDGAATLADLGLTADRLREARLIALADEALPVADRISDAGDREYRRSDAIKAGRAIESGIAEGQADDWYTPGWIFDALAVRFDLDPCAPADPAQRSCPADRYYSLPAEDGLQMPWRGLVWLNPPYSTPAPWVARMLGHVREGGSGVMLSHIPANAAWAVDVWRSAEVAVWLQAVPFARPNGETHRPGYALMLCGWGPDAVAAVSRADRLTDKAGAVWARTAGRAPLTAFQYGPAVVGSPSDSSR
jgi:hypothetical protein